MPYHISVSIEIIMKYLKTNPKDKQALQNVLVLAFAQAILGAQLPMYFILGGLAGQYLSPNPCLSTLPVTMIIIGSTITAPFLSSFMQKFGRRPGFVVGGLSGGLGSAISSYAIYSHSFKLFLLGSVITGIYMSSYGFYRFAATDTAREKFRPKAISYVVAAGLISAIFGPQLVKLTSDTFIIPFLGSYLSIILLNCFGIFIFFFLDIPVKKKAHFASYKSRTWVELLSTTNIKIAIICAMVSYSVMNLMMTAAPMAVVGCGFSQNNAADVVMAHVLAMSIPSLFTGHLIIKYGIKKILIVGLLFLFSAALAGFSGTELVNFFGALILLGLGWNFTFIAATTLLANSHRPLDQGKAQGINDMCVFGFVALASLGSGGLLNCAGGTFGQGWQFVSTAMLPLLVIAAITIIWLHNNGKKIK